MARLRHPGRRPGRGRAFDALIAKLQGLGLVYDAAPNTAPSLWTTTAFGRSCAAYLVERGTALGSES